MLGRLGVFAGGYVAGAGVADMFRGENSKLADCFVRTLFSFVVNSSSQTYCGSDMLQVLTENKAIGLIAATLAWAAYECMNPAQETAPRKTM